MLLAIDIGNTTVGCAIMRQGGIVSVVKIDTKIKSWAVRAALTKILKRYPITQAVICSVVPQVLQTVESFLKRAVPTQVVGRDVMVPMKNCYKNPRQVGQDRLVGAYAASQLYGKPLIVVDLGTAITFDVVSSKGEYLGGAIVPGIRLSAESLFLQTALLPQINIRAPQNPIGKTTQESILSGLFYGYGVLCQGFIDLLAHQLRSKPKVVMTGGHTQLMKKFVSPKIRIIDEGLVFKGLYFLALQISDR